MELEKIRYSEDSGAEAIRKLDRNQRSINDCIDVANLLKDRGYLKSQDINEGDANSITKSGKYFIRSKVKNMPYEGGQWYLEVSQFVENWQIQTAQLDNNTSLVRYCRTCVNSNWGAWMKIPVDVNVLSPKGYYTGDLNNLRTQGSYLCFGSATKDVANAPTQEWGTTEVLLGGTGSIIQFWTSAYGQYYLRHFDGNKWTAWNRVITENIVPTFKGGAGASEGGEIHLAKAPASTQWNSDLIQDVCGENLRFYIVYGSAIKIAVIDFSRLQTNENNVIATTETKSISSVSFLNGFERHSDASYGYFVRTGSMVHVNFLLKANGAGNAMIFKLPWIPIANEIHKCDNLELRTMTDGYLHMMGSTYTGKDWSYICIDFTYTCKGVV